jgi:hypothetical protein
MLQLGVMAAALGNTVGSCLVILWRVLEMLASEKLDWKNLLAAALKNTVSSSLIILCPCYLHLLQQFQHACNATKDWKLGWIKHCWLRRSGTQ